MVKENKKIYIWILIFVSVFFAKCNTIHSNSTNNIEYKSISSYFDLNVVIDPSQDTVILNNELSLTVIFKNKTNTGFYFHPDGLISLNRETHGVFVFDMNFTILNAFSNYDNLVLLEPHSIYSKTYKVKIKKSWCVYGKNELFVMYRCKVKKEQKRDFEILYGGLLSSIFEIFVEEK
ncbi:MAG: hypothetical protein FWF53_11695 [Candidatus Azobacteroides sp.]|nr:hypothetical protein [Candidatus Azobacteroides sp.]